jgi:hypothetical protein
MWSCAGDIATKQSPPPWNMRGDKSGVCTSRQPLVAVHCRNSKKRRHQVIITPHRCIQSYCSEGVRMFRVPAIIVLLGLIFCVPPSNEAMAQRFDETGVVYEAARNKIGLISHCRDNALLDATVANQAIAALRSGLPSLPTSNPLAGENGERAQQAGEDGFLDAGRKRDITSVARLFRTSSADLCQEWADETLRAQDPRPRRPASTIAVIEPVQPTGRAKPTAVRTPPAGATAAQRVAVAAPNPPMPEKAPVQPARTRVASLSDTSPTGALLVPPGERAGSGQTGDTIARTPNAAPLGATPPQSSEPTPWSFSRLFFVPIAKRRSSEPTAAPGVAEYCHKQRQICRKICNLRFRDDLAGCPQTCESRLPRCINTACFKWTEQELLIGERFGGYRCAQ